MLKKVIFGLVLAYFGREIFRATLFMGLFKHVYDHKPGPCRLVDGIDNGSEDGEHIGGGLAIISSGFTAGTTYVYVVNHNGHIRNTVEKFEVDTKTITLTHVKTFADENFRLLNDVAVVGEDIFFTSNLVYTLSPWGNMLEMSLQFHWGSVVLYKDGKSTLALTGYYMPNGVAYDSTRKLVYVMDTGTQEVHVFDLNKDNTLQIRQKFPIYTIGDNLNIDPESGDIWIGAHSILWKFMRHASNKTERSPSQVLKLSVKANSIVDMVEVYSDNGQQLTGSSFASRYKDSMIVGTVHDKLLHCNINIQV